ncbi:MAG: large subunit ribosomal protein [Abditibacteriota bacterium]|nr:large subunit ribosomal protein [Abditibacteriota bacterium]
MSTHELKVTSRQPDGKSAAKQLRREGQVPAVVYGHKETPVTLALNAHELSLLLMHGGGRGLLVLKQEGQPDMPVVIKALQKHPYKPRMNSVDFLRVSLDEDITATVPVVLTGEPVGVHVDGGVLVHALHEIVVSAHPQDLPEHIAVDVSELVFDGAPILVREITLPAGVRAVTDGETPIAVVNPPEPEEAEETLEAATDADAVPSDHGNATTAGEAGDDSRTGTNDGKE